MAGVSWWIVGVTCGVVGVIVIVVGQPAPPPLAGGHCGGPFVGNGPHAMMGQVWTANVGHCAGLIVWQAPNGQV